TIDLGLKKLEADLEIIFREACEREKLNPNPTAPIQAQISSVAWEMRRRGQPLVYPGDQAFRLYDTFGIAKDFTEDVCRDSNFDFDALGFDRAMQEQRERARASWKGGSKATASPAFRDLSKTVFDGYRQTESDYCEVLAIVKDGRGVPALKPGEEGEVVLDRTPFYADSGGQVGDIGIFYNDERNAIVAEVNG